MMAPTRINSHYYLSLRKKRKIHNRRRKQLIHLKDQVKASETKSVVITVIALCIVFAIIAYFKPQ